MSYLMIFDSKIYPTFLVQRSCCLIFTCFRRWHLFKILMEKCSTNDSAYTA